MFIPFSTADTPVACFRSLHSTTPPPSFDGTLVRLLWGYDPYLLSKLLSAIADEAHNRGIPTIKTFDPLLSEQIIELDVAGMGRFTLSPDALSSGARLIDCTLSTSHVAPDRAGQTKERLQALEKEIRVTARAAADNARLLQAVTAQLADRESLLLRADRIARRFPRGDGRRISIPAVTCGRGGELSWHLPCSSDTRLICLQALYGIGSLFLDDLAAALETRGVRQVSLTHALTDRIVGIYIPDGGLCYLQDYTPPTDSARPCRQLALRRYLLPHSTEQRRAWRNLAMAVGALERHLEQRIAVYRTIAKEEEAACFSLYSENRLQGFRKRLLIDLFCS